MKLNKKIFFFQLILLSLFPFENSYSIHHHPRLDLNLLEDTKFLGKNRVLILNLKKIELLKFIQDFKNNKCEIENRKIEIVFKKDNKFYFISDDNQEINFKFTLPHKVSLIGLDGNLKFVDNYFSGLKKYFNFIDEMPIRKKEIPFDKKCIM